MADTEEMRRLILHAAERLHAAGIDHGAQTARLASCLGVEGQGAEFAGKGRAVAAAIVLAETTLRFVAACMGVEEQPQPAMPLLSATPEPEPPADGPRRTRRIGAQS